MENQKSRARVKEAGELYTLRGMLKRGKNRASFRKKAFDRAGGDKSIST